MKRLLLLLFMAAFLTLGAVSPPDRSVQRPEEGPLDEERFPITIDFHCPRNFGFHIGDEIPLTVTLTAKEGIIVDLINLPQKRDTHGPFEIRHMKVRKRQENGQTIYTVSYRLQCFTPAIAVDRLSFPPLRISYAAKEDWDPMESEYHYQGLFSQPYDIFVSRTASYFGPMKDLKGPMMDRRIAVMWKVALIMGGLLTLAGLVSWPWEFIRKKQRVGKQSPSLTAADRALQALYEARENCFNYEDHRKRLFFEINAILRDFLREVCGLNTANRPSMEIINQLKDRPGYEDLRDFVARINQVIYEGDAPVDVEPIVRQFSGLLQKLDGTAPSGVHHDKAG